ncbi:MAG: carboxylesterase family protein [Myxococcota bacterium]
MSTEPVATTAQGSFRGIRATFGERVVHRFRGIPYAAPPVGALRFAPPAPPPAARGAAPFDATRYGAAPPQRATPLTELLGMTPLVATSEDCLTLNVDAPQDADGPRPVLFWLHGGAYQTGTGAAATYDGLRLAARANAVVVTCNYRVGALGFAYLDASGPPGAPRCANLGLLDQVAALEWVRAHVGAFGGDASRVTVVGESAGAGSIHALLAMPRARGLFAGAIAQSGAPDGFLLPQEARERTARLLDVLGVDARALAHAPADALLDAQEEVATERLWRTGMFFAPVVDGDVLPESPLEAAHAGRLAPVPLVVGTTRDELQLYKYGAPRIDIPADAVANALAGQLPGRACGDRARAQRLVDVFRAGRAARGESTDGLDLVYAIQADLAMRTPAARIAALHAARGHAAYAYRFTWASPLQDGALGACHALDCPFVFGTLDAAPALVGDAPSARAVSDAMIDAWGRFAHGGAPACDAPGLGDWPRYDARERATMEIGDPWRVVRAPAEEERLAIEALLDAA